MTASLSSNQTTSTPQHAAHQLREVAERLERAGARVGTRMGAFDLIEVAGELDKLLPRAGAALTAAFDGEAPMRSRMVLSVLRRASSRARELGEAGSGVVPAPLERPGQVIAEIAAWSELALELATRLDHDETAEQ